MKKAVWVAIAILAWLSLVRAAEAQPATQFGIDAGLTYPLSDLGEVSGTGWHAGALVSVKPPSWPIAVRIDGTYHDLGSEAFGLPSFPDFNTSPTIFNVTVNGVYGFPRPGSRVEPYLLAGVGLYSSRVFEEEDRRNDTGVNVGGGVRFQLTRFSTFVEARWHNIFSEGASTKMVPLSVGITLR